MRCCMRYAYKSVGCVDNSSQHLQRDVPRSNIGALVLADLRPRPTPLQCGPAMIGNYANNYAVSSVSAVGRYQGRYENSTSHRCESDSGLSGVQRTRDAVVCRCTRNYLCVRFQAVSSAKHFQTRITMPDRSSVGSTCRVLEASIEREREISS